MSANLRVPAGSADLGQPYDAVSRTFHWLVVALVAAQVTIALLLPAVLPASAEDATPSRKASSPPASQACQSRLAGKATSQGGCAAADGGHGRPLR